MASAHSVPIVRGKHLDPQTVTHVIQQPFPCCAPLLSKKKGGTAFRAFPEEATVNAFQAKGEASTQDKVPQPGHRVLCILGYISALTSFNGLPPIILLSIISHGLLNPRETPIGTYADAAYCVGL